MKGDIPSVFINIISISNQRPACSYHLFVIDSESLGERGEGLGGGGEDLVLVATPGGTLPYISYTGTCRPSGYGFLTVRS